MVGLSEWILRNWDEINDAVLCTCDNNVLIYKIFYVFGI